MNSTVEPFADRALDYLNSGLGWPIPSAYPYEKHPPLTGWTGGKGGQPDEGQVRLWREQYHDSNICLRLAPNVIGIDIDGYDEKQGAVTIAAAEEKHGSLPLSYRSTARHDDPISGIRFFRLQRGMDESKLRDVGDHVETIRFSHRYAVVPPSWHSGVTAEYQWEDGLPSIDDLPYLPPEWHSHLTHGCMCYRELRKQRKQQMQRFKRRPDGNAGSVLARMDLDQALNRMVTEGEGTRNNMLSWIAGRTLLHDVLTNKALDYDEVANAMTAAALEAGLDKRETENTIESAARWAHIMKEEA